VLLVFAFLSPLIVGVLFVLVTQVFFSVSAGISSALSSVSVNASQYNIVSATVYSSNLPSCGANMFSGNFWTCLGSSMMFYVFSHAYTVGFEAAIINTAIHLMLSPFGINATFEIVYEIIILFLYVYGFIKIDWFSLQYISALKTGEKEATSFEKLKRTYIQYIGFIISPILLVVAIILLNSFLATLISAMTSSSMYLIPPLLNINGVATASNLLIDIAGFFMIIFAIILILVVILFVLLRFIGGIIFAVGIFLYLSEDYKHRAFGKNLLIGFMLLYLIPLILLLIYSFWFGFLSSAISSALGSSHIATVQATIGSYTATPVHGNSAEINIQPGNVNVVCNNGTSIYSALSNSKLNNSDAHGVLLAGCANFVGYWGNGYIIMAFVSLLLLIALIYGFGAISGAIGGLTGAGGGEGAISMFNGLSGKPLLQKMSKIASNMQKNRSRYLKSVAKKGGIGNVAGSAFLTRSKGLVGSAVKVAGGTENLAYGLVTAPIAGTALGNALDRTRQVTKNVIASAMAKPEDYSYGKADDVINEYAKKIKKEGESEKDAKIRAKKELQENYGFIFDDKSKTFRVSNKNLTSLEDKTGIHLKTSISSFKELEGYNEAKKEYNKVEKEYEKVEKAYKDGKASKSRLKKAKQKRDEAKKKLDDISVKGGYKDSDSYEDMKNLNDAYTDYQEAINSDDNKKKSKAKENLKNAVKTYEKKYGAKLNGGKLVKMMESSEGRMDVRNIMATALSLQDTEMSAKFISGAVNGDKVIIAKERLLTTGNGIAKAFKTEFINPATSEARERFHSVKDILGKMKNYNLISGVGLVNEYNSEIKDIDSKINKAIHDYDNDLEILKSNNPNISQKDKDKAQKELSSLQTNLEVLTHKKQQLERSRKYVESPEMLILSALNKKAIDDLKLSEAKEGRIISTRDAIHKLLESGSISSPFQVLDNLSKLASGDELGRINLTKAMLDNELRIKKKAVIETEKEINKIKWALKNENLTESQKLQYKKMEEDLTYKYSMLNTEVKRITLDSGEMNTIVKSLKVIRKPIIASTEYTIEKDLGNYINSKIIENSELPELSKEKKPKLEEQEQLNELNKIANILNKKNIKDGNFDLIDSVVTPKSLNLIEDYLYGDSDVQIVRGLTAIKNAVNNGEDAINSIDKIGPDQVEKLLNSLKGRLFNSLEEYKKDIYDKESLKKYNEFIKSVNDKITPEKLENTSLVNLASEIQKEFENTGLDKFVVSSQISDRIMNELGNDAVTKKMYEVYGDNYDSLSKKLKNIYIEKANEVANDIAEISEKEEPLLKKDICNIIYGPETKSIYTTNQAIRDRELFGELVKKILENKSKNYNFQESTISVLSSLDNSIDEITDKKEKEKAINFVYNEILPELKNTKYNLFTKVVSNETDNYKDAQEHGDVDTTFFNRLEISRLNDLQTQVETTKLAIFKDEFRKAYTTPKNHASGNIQRKRSSHGIKSMHVIEFEKAQDKEIDQKEFDTFESPGEHWGVFNRGRKQYDDDNDDNEDEDSDEV